MIIQQKDSYYKTNSLFNLQLSLFKLALLPLALSLMFLVLILLLKMGMINGGGQYGWTKLFAQIGFIITSIGCGIWLIANFVISIMSILIATKIQDNTKQRLYVGLCVANLIIPIIIFNLINLIIIKNHINEFDENFDYDSRNLLTYSASTK